MPKLAEYGLDCKCPRLSYDQGIVIENPDGPGTISSTQPIPRIDIEVVADPMIQSGFGYKAKCRVCGVEGTKIKPFVPRDKLP